MSEPQVDELSGSDLLDAVLTESGVEVIRTTPREVHKLAESLFERMREKSPVVVVIEARSVVSLDVQALRWLFPGGFPPLVLCPSNADECIELGEVAVQAANFLAGPVFILLEDQVAKSFSNHKEISSPELIWEDPLPLETLEMTEPESELQFLSRRMSIAPRGFLPLKLDPCPPEMGKPEWLLISYGSTAAAAQSATDDARKAGQRVTTATVRQLWPVPEVALVSAAMGLKHVVMAELNLGQYAREIRRVLPELPVVPANRVTEPVPAELILDRLQRTPRCC